MGMPFSTYTDFSGVYEEISYITKTINMYVLLAFFLKI